MQPVPTLSPKYTKEQLRSPPALLDMNKALDKTDFKYVYRPDDDSYLFIDTLYAEIETIIAKSPLFILEIGTGSGFLINNLSSYLKLKNYKDFVAFGSDINIDACLATQKFSQTYNNDIQQFTMDILSSLEAKKVEIILFNPPYVCTEPEEVDSMRAKLKKKNEIWQAMGEFDKSKLREVSCIDAAYVGGENGDMLYDKILTQAYHCLCDGGWFYFLIIEDNDPESVIKLAAEKGFSHEVMSFKKAKNEREYIIKFVK